MTLAKRHYDDGNLALLRSSTDGADMSQPAAGPAEADTPEFPLALPIGAQIGELQIQRVLGQGSFGITYLAQDRMLGSWVALKEYLPRDKATRTATQQIRPITRSEEAAYQAGLQRFMAEGRTVAPLDHPNVVKVIRCFEMNGTAYLQMPFYQGETLSQLLEKSGRFNSDEIAAVFWPVLDALEYLHGHNVTHRDIKPANIYVTAEGTPILIDFGAARITAQQGTESHTAMGSEGFAAREQSSSRGRLGPWTDIYGLSATVYRLITGEIPISANDRADEVYHGQPDPLPHWRQWNAQGHDPKFLQAIARGLAIRIEDRPQSVAEWLVLFRQPTAEPATHGHPRVAQNSPAERSWFLPTVSILVVLALIGGALLLMWYPESPPPSAASKPDVEPTPAPDSLSDEAQKQAQLDALEREAWQRSQAEDSASAYQAYLDAFPTGSHAGDAQLRMKVLEQTAALEPKRESRPKISLPRDPVVATTSSDAIAPPATAQAPHEEPQGPLRDCPVCPVLVIASAGAFWQGAAEADALALSNEKPRHRVSISRPFAIAAREVTFAQWDACVADSGCTARPNDNWGRGEMPVINVSWNDTQQYLDWLSKKTGKRYRLPSESEWEYAARAGLESAWLNASIDRVCESSNVAGTETPFHWRLTACSDPFATATSPVGTFRANSFGLFDVIGNVAEWVQDCMNLSYVDAPADGAAWERGMCSTRVTRGGSWFSGAKDVRLSARLAIRVSERNDFTGFRVLRSVESAQGAP